MQLAWNSLVMKIITRPLGFSLTDNVLDQQVAKGYNINYG